MHPPDKPEKLQQADANYNMWKAAYDELNQELTKDIQRLCADRNNFFDPCFSTLVQAAARYYQEVAAITTSLVPAVQHIDGKAAHATRIVITDDEITTTLKTYESFKKAGSGVHTPSYQKPPTYAQQQYGAPASSGYGAPQQGYSAPPPQQYGAPQQGYGAPPQQSYGAPQAGLAPPQQQRAPPPMPGRPMPARPAADQARALYAFNPESPTELGFQPGQVLTIVTKNGDWWEAEINGRRGLIPANYVQLV